LNGALGLAIAHARHHRGRVVLLSSMVFLSMILPLGTNAISSRFATEVRSRASDTPLTIGARGSRFDLVMACLYFRNARADDIALRDVRPLASAGNATIIPLRIGHSARGVPIVATAPDYHQFRDHGLRSGHLPQRVGEVVVGAAAARRLGVSVDDLLGSDPSGMFDIARTATLQLRVVGVLTRTHTPDDDVLFTDLRTAWVLEGFGHAHAEAAVVPESLKVQSGASAPVLSEALALDASMAPKDAARFHLHASEDSLPLSGAILAPDSEKTTSLLKARINASGGMQAVVPLQVVEEMLTHVGRVQALVNAISMVLAASTLAALVIVARLAATIRQRETLTLVRIGASERFVASVFLWEYAIVLGLGGAATIVAWGVVVAVGADLVKLL